MPTAIARRTRIWRGSGARVHSRPAEVGSPWRRLREQILERDGYLCQCDDCKRRPLPPVAHEADHIDNACGPSGELNDYPSNFRAINRAWYWVKSPA